MGGTMRLGADPVKLHDGTRAREVYGEADLRAPPPPLRGQQPPPQAVRARRTRVLGHLAGRPPGGDRRAAGASVLRRLPVPSEFKSRPLRPQPLFREFVAAALERVRQGEPEVRAGTE